MRKHQITLDVEVPDGVEPGPSHLFDALEAALEQASRDPSALMGRVRPAEPPRDWVIRSEADPGLILTDNGTWTACAAETVPETARHNAEAGQSISLREGQAWCRRDLIGGEIVPADLHSDDRVIDMVVDIRPYLETATEDDINELIADDWSYAESADRVAYALEAAGDPGANRLFWYLGLNPGGTGNEQVGFGLRADGEAALVWIAENRPDLHARLDLDDAPDGP
jgi:hypothetical protein